MGFSPTVLASSKHNEEANCPNSAVGGFSNAKLAIWMLGNSFLRARSKIFSHSERNSAKGFSETIAAFLCLVLLFKLFRVEVIF
jgi:hypothetical protein